MKGYRAGEGRGGEDRRVSPEDEAGRANLYNLCTVWEILPNQRAVFRKTVDWGGGGEFCSKRGFVATKRA